MNISHHVLVLCFMASAYANAQTYVTDFESTENPVCENGKWNNGAIVGLDWTNVRTFGGIACGTQTGTDTGAYKYNDSYAILSGFPPNQMVEAVVHIANPSDSCNQEVELLLRWTPTGHIATGYECLARSLDSPNSYIEIVRWNGTLGDFSYIARLHSPSAGIRDGDTLRATIIGNQITFFVNGVIKLKCNDNTYSIGNPGIGFFLYGCVGTNTDFGFTRFAATGQPSVVKANDR